MQNGKIMHGQEIKEKEIITVSALQKGLIQPRKRKMENTRKVIREPEEVSSEVSDLFFNPTFSPYLNSFPMGIFILGNIYQATLDSMGESPTVAYACQATAFQNWPNIHIFCVHHMVIHIFYLTSREP